MDAFMWEPGTKADTRLASAHIQIRSPMKETGWKESLMDTASDHGLMEDNTKVSGTWENHMGTGSKSTLMEIRSRDSGEKESL